MTLYFSIAEDTLSVVPTYIGEQHAFSTTIYKYLKQMSSYISIFFFSGHPKLYIFNEGTFQVLKMI